MSAPDDLDRRIGAVMRAAVADAPDPPPIDAVVAVPDRPRRRSWLVAAAAMLVVGVATVAVLVTRSGPTHVTDGGPAPATESVPATDAAPVPTAEVSTTVDPAPATTAPSTTEAPDPCIDVPLPPTILPDGTTPGVAVVDVVDGQTMATWGTAEQQVRQVLGAAITDVRFDGGPSLSSRVLDGITLDLSVFARVGNPPATPITIQTRDASGCVREYEVGPGITFEDATAFANDWRFAIDDARPKVAPTDGSTLLAARSSDWIAHPTSTVVELGDLDPDLLARSPDGRLVAIRHEADGLRLVTLVDGAWIDTAVTVPASSTTWPRPRVDFGPGGDLYIITIESTAAGDAVAVLRVRIGSDGSAAVIDRASGTAEMGRCAPAVEADRVGCAVGQGPAVEIDPAQPFDHAMIDPMLTTVTRSGPSGDRTWTVAFDGPLSPGCVDDGCLTATTMGPAGQVLWDLSVEEPHAPTNRLVYVLDDRAIAGVVWLDGRTHAVLGVDGTDLLASYVDADGRATIERFDLAPVLTDATG